MDPYLDGDLWTTVHAQLGTEIARHLVPKLRPKYLALTVERFVLDMPDGIEIETKDIYPDVGAVHSGPSAPHDGTVSLMPAPLQLAIVVPSRVPQFNVEIRDTKNRRLVTAIEILSPTNKRGRGRNKYLAKRRRLYFSDAHFMEIDLVRRGRRVPMQQPLPPAPYYVLLSRVKNRPILDVWPISFQDFLPVIPVPLLPGDPEVTLDLQAVLTNVYDLGGYDLALDYTQPPDVPLPPDIATWADERLRAAGLRS
jgi:hypothetical protein